MNDEFPLPGRLNLAIATVQLAVLLGLLAAAGAVSSPWALAGLAVGYALVMNSTYASMKRSMDCCILTGFFYLAVVLGNGIALVHPRWLKARWADFDRPTRARLDSLTPRYFTLIRIEALVVIVLHGGWMMLWHVSLSHYLLLLGSFGVLWSALQYVHHFGTDRDVSNGARNLRTWPWLDALWLNHDGERGRLLAAYLRMWRGPRHTGEHVKNHHAGKIIR